MKIRSLTPALLVLAFAGVVVWQLLDYRSQVDSHVAEHRRYGIAVLNAYESVAFRECRGGQYQPDSLDQALAETRHKFGLAWLTLRVPGGRTIASAGSVTGDPHPQDLFSKPFQPPQPRRGGFGRRYGAANEFTSLPEKSLELAILTDPALLEASLEGELRRNLLTTLSVSLALLLFAGLYWLRTRSLELQSQLRASEEKLRGLDYLRRLGAGLVHETKNPLSVVRGFAERILNEPLEAESLTTSARAILDETDRTVTRLDEFLLLSRPAELRRKPFPIDHLLHELQNLLSPDLANRSAKLEILCSGQTLNADREQLRRLFMNLLLNAIAALPEHGHIRISCEATEGLTRISIADDGCGVPEELRETLFQPYVSGREGGTGLGLSIAHRIALDHGFALLYEPITTDGTDAGTRMILEAPRP